MNTTTEQRENQIKILSQKYPENDITEFFNRLDYGYGDGEVLEFKHIENIFSKEYNLVDEDYLTIYIDTVRAYKLLERNSDDIINLEHWEDVLAIHLELSQEYAGTISEKNELKYNNAVTKFNYLTQDNEGFKVELISTAKELQHEGDSMEHCIATYHNIISEEKYIGLRFFNKTNQERLTLGLFRNGDTLYFNQFKGHYNSPASKDSCQKVLEYCEKNNILILENQKYDLMPLGQ